MNCVSCICFSKYNKTKVKDNHGKNHSNNYEVFITPPTPPKKFKNDLINIKNDIKVSKEK